MNIELVDPFVYSWQLMVSFSVLLCVDALLSAFIIGENDVFEAYRLSFLSVKVRWSPLRKSFSVGPKCIDHAQDFM